MMGKRSGGFCAAAALALSMAMAPHAQQRQMAPPAAAPLTEVQTAGVKRVKEMIEALNSGDYATIRAYFESQSDPNGFVNALGNTSPAAATTSCAWRSYLVPTSLRESSATG